MATDEVGDNLQLAPGEDFASRVVWRIDDDGSGLGPERGGQSFFVESEGLRRLVVAQRHATQHAAKGGDLRAVEPEKGLQHNHLPLVRAAWAWPIQDGVEDKVKPVCGTDGDGDLVHASDLPLKVVAVATSDHFDELRISCGPSVLLSTSLQPGLRVEQLLPERLLHELWRVEVREALPKIHAVVAQRPCELAELREDILARRAAGRLGRRHSGGRAAACGWIDDDLRAAEAQSRLPQHFATCREVAVHHDLVPFPGNGLEFVELASSRVKPALAFFLIFCVAIAEPLLQRRQASGRLDEHETRLHGDIWPIEILPEVMDALEVDVEYADLSRVAHSVDGAERRAI
mmetsp:Transcript_99602/g.281048  ORF Transcript_99602/g.281048 Transcript_99602/m.281048 type:complete len:346 (+) Transcript_99602:796-1833(+)